MSDRLSTMLHDEAGGLDVPVPPAADVLARGRRMRRDRRTRAAVTGAAVVALLAVAGTLVTGLQGSDRAVGPADQSAYQRLGAWADGDGVHIGERVVQVPDAHVVAYTPEGVLVASVDLLADDPGDSVGYTLVRPDGHTEDLGVLRAVDADATDSEIALVRPAGDDVWELVLRDLRSGEERTLGEPWRMRQGPPEVAMAGRYVVVLHGVRMMMIDRETGETLRLPRPGIGMTTFDSFGPTGYLTARPRPDLVVRTWQLRSLPDGALVGTFPDGGGAVARISPDGRYLATGDERHGTTIYDVRTGDRVPLGLPVGPRDIGWSPDGHVLTVLQETGGRVMESCSPDGSCEDLGSPEGDVSLVAGSGNSGTPPPRG